MNKAIYFIILVISFSLAFSQSKPCCKNKAGKGKVSCKFNQANIDVTKDGIILDKEIQIANKPTFNCAYNADSNYSDQNATCNGCKKSPWWKFWGKKKNCCNTKA